MSGHTISIKVLGASSDKADANLYIDGEKAGEVTIRREANTAVNLIELLGESFNLIKRRR